MKDMVKTIMADTGIKDVSFDNFFDQRALDLSEIYV
jgi:predicted ATPase